jgi:UDP-N-acetylglucosamine acyltransferase
MKIHPTAIVDRHAELGEDVEVGPYAVIHAGVRMGARCRVHSHAVIGDLPQDKRGGDKPTRVEIGDDNVFREHVTVHRGTRDSITKIGSNNLFMVGCHVAHDVTIGSRCVIANSVQLAGHSVVEDYATFGGLAGIAQFVRVGESAFVAAGAMVERNVPPFCIVQGDRARVRAVNRVGLQRRGVPEASIAEIERVFRAAFSRRTTRADALASLSSEDALAKRLIDALR